jgi:hypothetical protein
MVLQRATLRSLSKDFGTVASGGFRADFVGQVLLGLNPVPVLAEAVRCASLESPDTMFSFLITPPSRRPCSGDQGLMPRP